ncbi:MAG: zinc-ribbon domain-containing protein [Oscillospiraceae bacterium]|nr:zinc-ribbon domain-containing protein [Oscillospiraceae bacterium]
MVCSCCGKELRDNAKFCSFCGATVTAVTELAENIPSAEEMSEKESNAAENAEAATEEITGEADVKEECTVEKEQTDDNISELAEKFHEKDGLFVINEQTSEISSVSVFKEKKKLPWVKISIAVVCAAAIGASAYIIPSTVIPAIKYSNAQKLYESGDYQGASVAFGKLGNYKESADYIMKCRYNEAEMLFSNGKYQEAADAFTALNGYSDSDMRADECMTAIAEKYTAEGDYDSAMAVYTAAGKSDLAEQTALKKIEALAENGDYFKAAEIAEAYCSEDVVTEYIYQGALAAKESGDFKMAADNFYRLGQYKDSADNAIDCTYNFYLSEYTNNGASEEIVRGFYFLDNYSNSKDLFIETSYEYGLECEKNGDYAMATAMFKNCGTYKSSMNEIYRSRYNLGKQLLDTDPASARSVFALMSTYGDSAAQKKAAAAKLTDDHNDWYADGFTSAGNYYTTVFRKNDTLLVSCTAGTDTISPPITLTLTFRDSEGTEITADCENVRNSGSFSGSFSLSSAASGNAEIIISRKDNGTVLRTIAIKITD